MYKSIRFPHYDYSSSGVYFLTLCVHEHECLFGDVVDGMMQLSTYGQIVEREWQKSCEIRPELQMDQFVVMPNHLHGIVFVFKDEEAHNRADESLIPHGAHCRAALPDVYVRNSREREPRSISSFIAGFKAYTTKLINCEHGMKGSRIWQPNYFEHIIRNERQLHRARCYIHNNPFRWAEDKYYR